MLKPTNLTAKETPGFLASAQSAGPKEIDLSAVSVFDSAGLAALVNLASKQGANFSLKHPPEKLRKLAALYGVDRIFSS